jgi:hypothetical protein
MYWLFAALKGSIGHTTLVIGGNQQFNAIALDQNNQPIPGINITWTSSNLNVGNITPLFAITGTDGNASATFDALAVGTDVVTTSNGSVEVLMEALLYQ